MLRRILAALVAIVLAAVAIVLVVTYANSADERALAEMETDNVFVAAQNVPQGTRAEELEALVETKPVPRQFQVEGRVTDLDDLAGRVATTNIAVGEQLQRGRFATPEELRARGEFTLPEDAKDLHQVTIPLDNPRALGGSIAPGDTVGVFGSFEVKTEGKYVLDGAGNVIRDPNSNSSDENSGSEGSGGSAEEGGGSGDTIDITDLLLHKVLVVRVEGGFVAPPPSLRQDAEKDEQPAASEKINVTLALESEDAARVVYAMEFGSVWLSLEPEGSDDDETPSIVISVPSKARNVLE